MRARPGAWRGARWRGWAGALAVALTVLAASPGVAEATPPATVAGAGRVVRVVAAENFWGSIASQIGGAHAQVRSIVTNPNADPHSYEPSAADARALADAQLVIENGIGYDPWMPKLRSANGANPVVLDVGDVLGVAGGGNPHRWYSPRDVQMVIRSMVLDMQRVDRGDGPYFAARQLTFDTVALQQYDATIAAIHARYAGVPVGASESVFAMLAPALGLDLITPSSFLKAISEGTDVSAADKEAIDAQIKHHEIKLYVYNSQNVTPDVRAQLTEVKAGRIPYATITETLAPATETYQAWQTRQLRAIQAALAKAP